LYLRVVRRLVCESLAKLRSRREEREFFAEWDRQGWEVPPVPGARLALTPDELEVACDVLQSLGGMNAHQRSLRDRLQPLRGGANPVVLTPYEAGALAQALDARAALDAREQRLRDRLRS
jgi:hypothetical protein